MITMKRLVDRLAKVDSPTIDREAIREAKKAYLEVRDKHGFKTVTKLLTGSSENIKLQKSKIETHGLSLAPARVSGLANMCPHSTRGCRDLCINVSGNGLYPKVQLSRIAKTEFLAKHPQSFFAILKDELTRLSEREVAVRLNVYSDVPWERAAPWIFSEFPDISFYDYTKDKSRLDSDDLPENYHLTFSASERDSDKDIQDLLSSGANVTVVADKVDGAVPTHWLGHTVVDGDKTDYRPSDPTGVIVFLSPKGKARSKKDAPRGRFVRHNTDFTVGEESAN